MGYTKILTASEAVQAIKNNNTVVVGGAGGGLAEPTELLLALEERFLNTASPRDLTFVHITGVGDRKEGGMCHVAYEGLVKRDIGGHWDYVPKMAKLASQNKIEAYNLPQGVLSQLFREIAANRPGLFTHVGLKTFVDPRVEGGKLNSKTKKDLVRVIDIAGQEKLFYEAFPVDIAFLRGTTADEDGNVSMEEEAAFLENLAIAQAVHNCGGKVFVQVKRLAARRTLHPKNVRIPGILVDGIIVCPEQPQTVASHYNPAYSGEIKIPLQKIRPLPFDERKVIAMRAALEIPDKGVINLGVGISGSVGVAATEMGLDNEFVFAVEQGVIGGVPAGGIEFGASINPLAIIDTSAQFDFFDGGGIDLACLGMAQVDEFGNVNVSKIGDRIIGCGGFINIAQNAKKIIYCGTFTAGGLNVEIEQRKLNIVSEGKHKKFVNQVDQITFSGEYARETGQKVIFITERAVFEIREEGMVLTEIAPGVIIEKDILPHMEFVPHISAELKEMDPMLFTPSVEKRKINNV
ncbi:acyl CoA:acetate/3-ketoacid CoA transferase [Bacillus sp. V3-13]|uniref:acyl CoA:acetate/3-ketoacid CoA transferase n=1 Tax=Bacillus sp. V3-13 TaxID=2053728 RepID=UPI000C758A89|nr:CoA-transferase [Bacillus sp. V3-13]PLR76765.1 acyl CoA:acetate/3-ketoacid CoA transferase [Bacillus sp. V3-13]